ncbi:MauE/DoxX family redox-associated membrane protein [Dyadobacter diqingensis]|uniref:MauE/DoxX family redox-associated membrane protein n=1 Tax=Dyadobacter diqingensis TaxID=2938121 RepID=UPI0020C1A053|nr:MauE/DoxX family redox-associated membrane protein [Dyadobacter diqingensis]
MKTNLLRLICAALILLFFYTATAKLSSPARFQSELSNQTVPPWSVPVLVWLIPATELIAVFLLIIPRFRLHGLYGSAALMLVFTVYMGLVLLNVYEKVPCSCGGVLKNMGFKVHFVFNLFFLLLSLAGIWLLKFKANRPD